MFLNKMLYYCLFLAVSLILMLVLTYVYVNVSNGVLFFSGFSIAFVSSFAGFFFWQKKYKNHFENFMVLLTYIYFLVFFIYFGPVTLDRSLSSFIYFYSVENGKITRDIFDLKYFDNYIQRRFTDGSKIGYLKCDDKFCYPTMKTKMTYHILFPIGKMTKTLEDYKEFTKMMDKRKL